MTRARLVLAVFVLGCSSAAEPPPAPRPDPSAELAALDPRTPVPLLPRMAAHQRAQMRDHLLVVQEVTDALGRDDLEAAASAASRLGTSDSMTAMCTHMGAGAPGFTERALEMHRQADAIALAARSGDRAATTRALATTLASCTGCHAAYRQQIVDEAQWTALTGAAQPHGAH
ncbi:cytochrome c [Sandaracinus amylolyticus]|uniref:Cytochrome C n=1 Tax=Sandaracinus amylolyticus TaxID=927083 RepID=A0A0F6W0L0_9BACT|nr:cytochrome c [Sandaracinus amylolyticus]AKF04183.1 hypothetical protein DB32_001332 [Sandaracinus amylolyticus]